MACLCGPVQLRHDSHMTSASERRYPVLHAMAHLPCCYIRHKSHLDLRISSLWVDELLQPWLAGRHSLRWPGAMMCLTCTALQMRWQHSHRHVRASSIMQRDLTQLICEDRVSIGDCRLAEAQCYASLLDSASAPFQRQTGMQAMPGIAVMLPHATSMPSRTMTR